MASQPMERRLAAILAADAVGYSRLMNAHEEATLVALRECLEIFEETIAAHGGHMLGRAGDGFIAEFSSSVQALRAALAAQEDLARRDAQAPPDQRIQFRIGLNVGDVVVEGTDLMGDGVNVAARIEGLAEPGGIALSEDVYRQVRNKVAADFAALGGQKLKNIPDPVPVYRVLPGGGPPRTGGARSTRLPWRIPVATALVLAAAAVGWLIFGPVTGIWPPSADDRPAAVPDSVPAASRDNMAALPSIVVLPFETLADNPVQDDLADGITEDIITDLSRMSNLLVMASNTSFKYKGQQVDPRDIRNELNVDFVLKGSIRRHGDALRVNAQLVDAQTGFNKWAERYDRRVSEVFAVQDDVTRSIVEALAIKLTSEERRLLQHRATDNVLAYDLFLEGRRLVNVGTKDSSRQAREAYRRAIEADPTFGRAYGALAFTLAQAYRRGWTDSPAESIARALELAKKAVVLDSSIPQTHWALGYVYLMRKEFDKAQEAAAQSIRIAPNYADGYGLLALISNNRGKPERAIELITKGMRLNPYYTWDYPYNLGRAYYMLGRYDEAIRVLEAAQERNENATPVTLFLTASYVGAGRQSDAEWEATQLQVLNPTATLTQVEQAIPITDPELKRTLLEDLRKAGLPE